MLLDIHNFDVILGMDWLSFYHAKIWCFEKVVVFYPGSKNEFYYISKGLVPTIKVVSTLKAMKSIRNGC